MGIPPEGVTAKVNENSNTIAITTRNPLTVKNILGISSFPATDGEIHTTAFQILGSSQSRGVIYLRCGITKEETKDLKEDVRCRTYDIVIARPVRPITATTTITTSEMLVLMWHNAKAVRRSTQPWRSVAI